MGRCPLLTSIHVNLTDYWGPISYLTLRWGCFRFYPLQSWNAPLNFPDLEYPRLESPISFDESPGDGIIIRQYRFGKAGDVYHFRYTAAAVDELPDEHWTWATLMDHDSYPIAIPLRREWRHAVLLDNKPVPWSLWKRVCQGTDQPVDWTTPQRGIEMPEEYWKVILDGMPEMKEATPGMKEDATQMDEE